MTGSNEINVSKGGGLWGAVPLGAKAFLLVTDNRKSRLDSEELTMQLSQTLSSAIAQIKVSNIPITNQTKKILSQRPPPFINFCIT